MDLLVSSLTKIFDGRGNVLAGSVVINSLSPAAAALQELLTAIQRAHDLPRMCREDAVVLERNSRSFLQRSQRSNLNADALARHLAQHPDVATVYYPSLTATGAAGADGADGESHAGRIFKAVHRRNELCFTKGDNPWQLDCEIEKMMAHSISRGSLAPTASKVDLEALAADDAAAGTGDGASIGGDAVKFQGVAAQDAGFDVGLALEDSDTAAANAAATAAVASPCGPSPPAPPVKTMSSATPLRLRDRSLSHSRSIGRNLAGRVEAHRPGYGCLLSMILKPHASTKVSRRVLRLPAAPLFSAVQCAATSAMRLMVLILVCFCLCLYPEGVLRLPAGEQRAQLGHELHSCVSVHAAGALQ